MTKVATELAWPAREKPEGGSSNCVDIETGLGEHYGVVFTASDASSRPGLDVSPGVKGSPT